MTAVVSDSWSCPSCGATVDVVGIRLDCAVALAAVREHHRCDHHRQPPSPSTGPLRAVRAARPIPPIPNRHR